MQRHREKAGSDGFTLVELLLGIVVFVIAAVVMGNHIATNYQTTATQRDKVFAFTKAQAILSEIHAFVDRGDVEAAIDLDVIDDGTVWKPSLTVAESGGTVLPPDHPLSGNYQRESRWVWARKISVRPFSGLNNRNVRYVTVRIGKLDSNGRVHELASLSSVVNSVGSAFPATQVFDVYLLATENIPGWWVYMEAIVPFVESAITDLENRNPGLSVRSHWITKSGYGRNRAYRPTINAAVDSLQPVYDVYYYPGAMPAGSASSFYYVPDLIKGRIAVDGVERNGYDAVTNPYPYALADFYNHCMRYPRAKEFHDRRVETVRKRRAEIQQALANGTTPPPELVDMSEEPPLQLLLEDMAANPDRYRHALLINLHGELLPTPPLRNYADAAKAPEALPFVRVVCHPEELRTQSPPATGTETTDVRLRVYAYTSDPDYYRALGLPEVMDSQHPIALQVMDMDLTDGSFSGQPHPDLRVEVLRGGVDETGTGAGSRDYQPLQAAKTWWDAGAQPLEMSYSCWFIDPGFGQRKYTMFFLQHTPVVAPAVNNRGVYANERGRLYGLEYVPAACESAQDFSRNLYAFGNAPKNTARWLITIPGTMWDKDRFVDVETPPNYYDPRDTSTSDVTLTVRTRIWDPYLYDPMMSGTWPEGSISSVVQPDNFSETYTWWAATRDAVPFTERAQIWGDPRHNPYRDLLTGDPDFGDGYNWFHDSLTNNSENAKGDFPGILRAWNRWNGGPRMDVPRLFELFRAALVNSESIYTTLSGYSYYYVGCGNEIGYDVANGYANSIPTTLAPWGGGAATGYVDNITGYRCYVRSSGSNYWWGMPWLGELYPDWAYSTDWLAGDAYGDIRGNLVAGTTPTTFHRRRDQDVYQYSRFQAYGTRMDPGIQRTSTPGCVSFFNIGSTSRHFNHHFHDGWGTLVGSGVELATNYGFPMPTTAFINRPFSVDTGGNLAEEYGYAPYSTTRYNGSILRTYYDHSPGETGSGIVQIEDPRTRNAAWVIVNGLAQTTETGTAFLAKYCLLSMFQTYFELGDKTLPYRIPQPPRVEITAPTEITELTDPSFIDIQFEVEWLRWDRLPYTAGTPASFSENENEIDYVITYSPDIGTTWYHVQDDSLATIGTKPTDPTLLIADQGAGPETWRWSTPRSNFPEGSYLVRVEAYRRDMALHYSVHQVKIYVER